MLLTAGVAQNGVGVVGGDEVCLDSTAVMSGEAEFVDADELQHGIHLFRCAFVVVIASALLGLAVAFQVDADAAVGDENHRSNSELCAA